MSRYPQDCEPRKIGSKARQIVISSFNMEHWEFHKRLAMIMELILN